MAPEVVALIAMILVISLVLAGIRLAFSFMFLAVLFGYLYRGPRIFDLFIQKTYEVMQNEVLIAVPLFVFMGIILEKSEAAEKLFSTMFQLFGPIRGGLAITTVIISTLFAACTGIIAASVTMMALIAFPAMLKRNYDKGLASGVVCAGGTLGILIPPSVMLVMMGPMCNLSVAKLFAGAIFPGLLLSGLYVVYILVLSWLKPEVAPAISAAERAADKKTLIVQTLIYMIPVFGLLVGVLGSILLGMATPTEASAVGALGAIIVALAYKRLNLKVLKIAVYETLKITSMVFFVIIGAGMFTAIFLFMRGGALVESFLLATGLGKWGILALMMFVVFILGMFIDWIGILYIVIPVFLPIAVNLGFDPLYFVELIAINLQMSFLTPPFAYAIFFLKGVAPPEVKTTDIYRGVVPFVALQALGLTLCIIFPDIVMWLPTVTLK
ncbi:MAG: TRAP transporter large permease subunit [Synergistetes bacterium]|nr:TRAP transporter large permease subunit [Synergistota bacterium]MCX8127218.1 TRAP transporter large permease subunit [Synergistota bacterium]MDW8191896.1 TRAP transporter large permease subunit [Synergistota bacterium]